MSSAAYALGNFQVHTSWVTFKCIRTEWPSSAYFLIDLQVHTPWVTIKCIHPEWPLSAYTLSHLQVHTAWVTFKCIRTESPSNAYVLSEHQVHTHCVTFNSIHSEWICNSYALRVSWKPILPNSERELHTRYVRLKMLTSWVIMRRLHSKNCFGTYALSDLHCILAKETIMTYILGELKGILSG